jgi:hypothetical protein
MTFASPGPNRAAGPSTAGVGGSSREEVVVGWIIGVAVHQYQVGLVWCWPNACRQLSLRVNSFDYPNPMR